MPEEGPYEIMPYKEIVKLKKDLEELQSKQGEAPSRELLKSMDNLTGNMSSMLDLFKSAADEMKIEEAAPAQVDLDPVLESINDLSAKIDDLNGKMDELTAENKTIAEGLIAVSDSINERFDNLSKDLAGGKPAPQPTGGPIPPPLMPAGPGPMPPGMPGPGGIEGTISAGGPAPSRLPKGKGPMPPGPPGMPPPGRPMPPGMPGPGMGGMPPPGMGGMPPPGGPPKKKGMFSFGK